MAAKRIYDIDGCKVTLGVMKANCLIRRRYGVGIRDHILGWRSRHPRDDWGKLAAEPEFRISRSTLFDWMGFLELGIGGSVVFDLRSERTRRLVAAPEPQASSAE